MKNIPSKSSIKEKIEAQFHEAYASLNTGDSSKKLRKLISRTSKKVSSEIHHLLVEDFKKKEKQERKDQKKAEKLQKSDKKQQRKEKKTKQQPAKSKRSANVKKPVAL